MAQVTAAVNLEIKGGSKLERLIRDVSRLESIVSQINAVPLKLDVDKAGSAFYAAEEGIKEVRKGIRNAQKDLNQYDKVVGNLQKNFEASARAASKLAVGTEEQANALRTVMQLEGRLLQAKNKRASLEERLRKEESKLPGAQRYLEETRQAERLTKALVDLSDEYLKLGRYQTRTPVTGKVAADQSKIGSIAQLRGQAEALSLIASNSEIASKQFNRFTIASQVANQRVFEARQRQLKALAEGLALPEGREARRQVGTRVGSQESLTGARSLIGSFVESYGAITKSKAALSDYISQASSLQSLVPFDSSEWSLLESVINDVNGELEQLEQRFRGLRGQSSSLAQAISEGIATPRGRSELLPQFSIQSAAKKFKYETDLRKKQESQVDKLVDLEEELKRVTLSQNEAAEIRNKLSDIYNITEEGSIDLARRRTVELKREIKEIKNRNREADKGVVAGERPFATPLGGGAEVRARNAAAKEASRVSEQVETVLKRLSGAQERITSSASAGLIDELQKNKLIAEIGEARVAIDEKRLTLARAIIAETDRQRRVEETANRSRAVSSGGTYKTGLISPLEGKRRVEGALRSAEILQQRLVNAQKEGLDVASELEQVRSAIADALSDDYQNTRKTLGLLLEVNDIAADRLKLEKLISEQQKTKAIRPTTTRGGESLGLDAPRRLRSTIASGEIARQSLINLTREEGLTQESRAIAVEKLTSLENVLNDAKREGFVITQANLDALSEEVTLAQKLVTLEKKRLPKTGRSSQGKGAGSEGTGLEAALKRLEEARGARQKFLGDVSAPEAIDKIVREFNKDSATGTASEAAQTAENVVGTYASKIAAGVPAVADAMMKLGKAGIDAIKKALGIASPSKVMLAIAKNQIDTYVDFLRAALPQVEAAAKAIGEAGTPKPAGVPESAIRKPITEKARTRPLTAEQLDRNSAIAEYAASQITGPMGQFEQVKRKIEDFIDKTRTSVDLDKLFGGQEDERFAMATRGTSAGPEFDKIRAALADFYQIPAELTPDLERGVKAAGDASGSADELVRYVSELTTGFEQISALLQSAAKLPIPTAAAPAVAVDNEFTRAQEAAAKADAAAAEAARKKAEAQKPFEASIQRAAELDAEAKRKADAAISPAVRAQIEADAKAGAEAISKAILDPIESAAPEGERQVRSAIGNLFDRVASALGFGGAGGGGRPPVPPTGGGGGPTRDPGDFGRRLSTAAEQGAEALLGLRELRDPTKATTVELEALSGVLKEFRKILDPTVDGFERLDQQLRESAANLDLQLERRAPDAGFLTRKFDPRVARGLSEGLIGGAFPLLFGQGIGASIGGAAGGFGGGFLGGGLGFGLSLVGTAAGTALDTAIQSAKDLGAALEKPVENFEQLAQQAFFSSKALESTIKKTIEYGDTATASALIQEEAIKKLGVDGVRNLQELASESDQLGRAFGELGQNMLAVIAGPLAKFTAALNRFFEPKVQAQRVENLRAGLAPQQREALNKELLAIGGPGSARYGAQQKLSEQGRGLNLPEIELAAKQAPEKIQAILDKYAPFIVKSEVKLDPKQKIESEINARQKQLEAMDIAKPLLDQVRSVNREQEDLDRQRAELVRSYEESIGNIRKQVEDRIADERRKNAQLELDIRAAAADLQLEKIKEANREFRGIFSDTLAGQTTERILDAVETITQIQNDGASQRANLELQIQNTAIETEKYKVEIANQVAKLNEETARRVDDINLSVRRRNEEYDQNRFTLEKRIAELQLKNNEILTTQQLDTAKKQLEAAKKAGDTQQQAYAKTFVDIYQSQLDIVQKGQQEVGAISAPSKLRGASVGVVGGGSVDTSGIDQAVNSGIRLQQALQGVQEQIRSVNSASALANIEESLNKQIRQAELLFFEFEMGGGARSKDLAAQSNLIDAINAKLVEQQDKMSPLSQKLREFLQFENGRFKIINFINKATAANTQAKMLEDLLSKEKELKILFKEAKQGGQDLSEVDRARLALQQAGLDLENDRVRAILDQAAAVDALNQKYKKLMADQQMQKELLDGIAGTFANTVGGAIDAAVSGTENFGEALKGLAADMFKTIARMLMMYAIAQALGALGGNDKGVGFFSTLARGFGFKESANGSYFANGVAAFANGGMFTNSVVSSPTLFKFADGGTMQTGVMGEAGPEAIMPLKRGPGGRLGVDASGSGGDNIVVTVNVDAKGSSVQGDDQRGNQLGRVISAAVQQELIKQKRPGGLLA